MDHISPEPQPAGDTDAGSLEGADGSARNTREREKPARRPGPGIKAGHPVKFRLYVAGDCPNSIEAEFNLRTFCHAHLPEQHEIEIVDTLRTPERALADGVLLTPMLVKLSPAPSLKIVGRLNSFAPLLVSLELSGDAPPPPPETAPRKAGSCADPQNREPPSLAWPGPGQPLTGRPATPRP